MKRKTLILAGSGHAHLEVIRSLSQEETNANKYILISPHRQTYYSGLVPRYIAGEIDVAKLTINSADFAQSKGIAFIQDAVQELDAKNNNITLASGNQLTYDVLSLNVGGDPTRLKAPSSANVVYLRPFDHFIQKWHEVEQVLLCNQNPSFVVIGGGAAAVEVALALRIRLNKLSRNQPQYKNQNQNQNQNQTQSQCPIHLVTQGERVCKSYSTKISERFHQSLMNSQIQVHFHETVSEIFEKTIYKKSGEKIAFDFAFVVTPTEPSKLTSDKVDSKLRLSNHVFAVGDGTSLQGHPQLPRSGVIAVHQGRHLIESLKKAIRDSEPDDFKIPKNQLNILITGEKTARAIWGRFSIEGQWVRRLKNWIDESYVKKFIV